MTITTTSLIRTTGLCAVAAGVLFVGVQVKHPPLDLDLVGTTEFTVRQTAKIAMTVFALAGVAGLYLRQVRQVGLLGLVGYVVFSLGYLTMFSVEAIAAFVLPAIETTSPEFVQDVLTASVGGAPAGDIGGAQLLLTASGVGYMVGGLLFGIALFRAGVVARWASALLAAATISTAALAVLPEAFNRPFAIPTGIALIGLGWSSWRTSQSPDADRAGSVRVGEPAVR